MIWWSRQSPSPPIGSSTKWSEASSWTPTAATNWVLSHLAHPTTRLEAALPANHDRGSESLSPSPGPILGSRSSREEELFPELKLFIDDDPSLEVCLVKYLGNQSESRSESLRTWPSRSQRMPWPSLLGPVASAPSSIARLFV